MGATEIVLIVIGVVVIIASFFITERLSQKDLEQISMMSQADLKHIAQKQAQEVQTQVGNSVEELIEDSLEITKRGLERETNNKIMAVSEYSDTVMESMNKTHNEIMFLYSMLNDKQSETADLISDLQRYVKTIRDLDLENVIARLEEQAKPKTKAKTGTKTRTKKKTAASAELSKEELVIADSGAEKKAGDVLLTKNEQILLLYKEGKDEVEIAKLLDCGLGEVRLVLGLYHEV